MQSAIRGQLSGPMDYIWPFILGLTTIFIAGVGMMLCTVVGSLAFPEGGVGAIGGAIVGFLLFLILGCLLTGLWKYIGSPDGPAVPSVTSMLPNSMAVHLGAHTNFKMIVTVHELRNVDVQGRMPWQKNYFYVEVECGSNPLKRTCVKENGQFHEQFKFKVTARDQSITFRIKNQGLIGESDVATAFIDIQNDILEPDDGVAFPLKRGFVLTAGDHDNLRFAAGDEDQPAIVLSFEYAPEEDQAQSARLGEDENIAEWTKDLEKQWKTYGAVQHLSQIQFNPSMQYARVT